MSKHILFVYGTLQRGQRNHRFLADQSFLGEARTAVGYRLYELGPYPVLVADATGGCVVGELWAVDADRLTMLDEFEGVPTLFDRRPIAVPGRAKVEAYFYTRDVSGARPLGERWPANDN